MSEKPREQLLEEVTAMQCRDGNWNWDPYMHGMANGLILALAIIQGGVAEFLEAPPKWLSDLHAEKKAKEVTQ